MGSEGIIVPYHIVKQGNKWAVKKKDNSKTFGTHGSKEKAKRQMAALYANESFDEKLDAILEQYETRFKN